jgi:ribosomal protein S12 methylthiotransferase accessory factor YcaO
MAVTLKALRRGTHRSASLNDTLKRVLPLGPVMGITRIANVTGLDSVGIPVVMVCRPNSRSVAVSQGKGIHQAVDGCLSMKLKAWMISIEMINHHAFNVV